MATNWNAVLANINNASDILAILRKVLGLLDGKVDLTRIDEIIADIENMQISVDTALMNVNSALSEFDGQAQEAIQQVIAAGLMEGFPTEAELLATRPTEPKKYAKAEDTDIIWFWNKPTGSPDGNYWISTGLGDYARAVIYTLESVEIPVDIANFLINKLPDTSSPKFGDVSTPQTITNASPGTYILATPASQLTTIKRFSVISNVASGDIELRVYSRSGNIFTMQKSIANLHVNKLGLNEFGITDFHPFTVKANEYVAAVVKTGGAIIYSGSSTSDVYYSSTNLGTGPITGTAGQFNLKFAYFENTGTDRAKSYFNNLERTTSESSVYLSNLLKDYGSTKGLSDTPSAKSGVNNGAGHMCIGVPISGFGAVSLLEVYSSVNGLAQVGVYTRSGTAFTRKRYVDVNLVVGLNSIPINLAISDGEYVGLRTTVIGQVEYVFNVSTGHEGMYVSSGAITDDTFNVSSTTPIGTTAYQLRFGLTLKMLANEAVSKPWAGKKWVPFGDSITWQHNRVFGNSHKERGQLAVGYQAATVNAMGCILDNQGDSGKNMPYIYQNRILPYDFSNTYITSITSGANDQRLGTPVGEIKPIIRESGVTLDTTTYAGALQAAIEHVIATNPACKIVLITPIRGWFNVINSPPDVPTTDPAALGVIKREYPDMVKAIGKLYGLPVVDFYDECGLNDLNKNYYLGDDPAVFDKYLLHATNLFYTRMGAVLLSTMRNL
ncbi:SGNH/GDSL hydrolase family protein [Acinetobacter pittii]|uniref:SGNH/GDSL hydrolase family protein n=1 Tax=Acinetobacter pittii TaxID=48296 RepID=UPI0036F48B45